MAGHAVLRAADDLIGQLKRNGAAALGCAEEEVEVAVAHLRVDGASWAQVGRALGISRQGARQRFGDAGGTHRTRQDPRDPQRFGR